jgi:[acyl-carrier-protein] S-malonyltransferase
MVACLFPGQGSQSPGMGRDIADAFPVAKRTYEEADDALGKLLSRLIFEGSEDDLKRTEITQPALLTTSVAAWRVLREEGGIEPRFAAGHSLGEWSALVAVGALEFADAVRLVHLRGRLMQEAVPEGEGGMAAVIGLEAPEVGSACSRAAEDTGQVVAPANLNSPEQTVVSGAKNGVDRAGALCREAGAKKVVPLAVSAPFHCALMEPAARGLDEALQGVTVRSFACPVVSNVEATPYDDPARTRNLLVEQVTSPVRWTESIQQLRAQEAERAIEIGPGKVLAGLCRRIDRKLPVSATATVADLKSVLASLGA